MENVKSRWSRLFYFGLRIFSRPQLAEFSARPGRRFVQRYTATSHECRSAPLLTTQSSNLFHGGDMLATRLRHRWLLPSPLKQISGVQRNQSSGTQTSSISSRAVDGTGGLTLVPGSSLCGFFFL